MMSVADARFPTRIYLIGMMGSGKSTLGKKLANRLGYAFADLDKLIEAKAGASIADIFESRGEAYFRERERDVLHETFLMQQTVISAGGGTPCFFDSMEQMRQAGICVYLEASPALLAERLGKQLHKRPLLAKLEPAEVPGFIEKKLNERVACYQQAQVHAAVPVKSLESLMESVLQASRS